PSLPRSCRPSWARPTAPWPACCGRSRRSGWSSVSCRPSCWPPSPQTARSRPRSPGPGSRSPRRPRGPRPVRSRRCWPRRWRSWPSPRSPPAGAPSARSARTERVGTGRERVRRGGRSGAGASGRTCAASADAQEHAGRQRDDTEDPEDRRDDATERVERVCGLLRLGAGGLDGLLVPRRIELDGGAGWVVLLRVDGGLVLEELVGRVLVLGEELEDVLAAVDDLAGRGVDPDRAGVGVEAVHVDLALRVALEPPLAGGHAVAAVAGQDRLHRRVVAARDGGEVVADRAPHVDRADLLPELVRLDTADGGLADKRDRVGGERAGVEVRVVLLLGAERELVLQSLADEPGGRDLVLRVARGHQLQRAHGLVDRHGALAVRGQAVDRRVDQTLGP